VVLVPRLHLANNDNAVCFKAAFPTSELKAHRLTYFGKMVRMIKPSTQNLSQIICKASILDNHVPL